MADVLQYWLNWFPFLFLEGGPLVIVIDHMIFLSPFLHVARMSMSAVSLLTKSDSGIVCLYRMLSLAYDLNGFKSRIN